MAASVAFTTDDGSYGEKGRVSDVLPEVIDRVHADVVYACGPMPMLEAVQRVAGAAYGGAGHPDPARRSRSRWPAASACA